MFLQCHIGLRIQHSAKDRRSNFCRPSQPSTCRRLLYCRARIIFTIRIIIPIKTIFISKQISCVAITVPAPYTKWEASWLFFFPFKPHSSSTQSVKFEHYTAMIHGIVIADQCRIYVCGDCCPVKCGYQYCIIRALLCVYIDRDFVCQDDARMDMLQ